MLLLVYIILALVGVTLLSFWSMLASRDRIVKNHTRHLIAHDEHLAALDRQLKAYALLFGIDAHGE